MSTSYLRTLREEAGLSQDFVAKAATISRPTLSKAESGQHLTKDATRRQIVTAIGEHLGWNSQRIEEEVRLSAQMASSAAGHAQSAVGSHAEDLAARVATQLSARESERSMKARRDQMLRLHQGYRSVAAEHGQVADDLQRFARLCRVAVFAQEPELASTATYGARESQHMDISPICEHTRVLPEPLGKRLIEADLLGSEGKMPYRSVATVLRYFDPEDPGLVQAVIDSYPKSDRPAMPMAKLWLRELQDVAWRLWQAYYPGTMPTEGHDAAAEAEDWFSEIIDEVGFDDKPSQRRRITPTGLPLTTEYLNRFRFDGREELRSVSGYSKQRLGTAAGQVANGYDIDRWGNAAAEVQGHGEETHIEVLWPLNRADEVKLQAGDQIVAEPNHGFTFLAHVRNGEVFGLIPKLGGPEGTLTSPGSTVGVAVDVEAVLKANGITVDRDRIVRLLREANGGTVTIDVDTLR